MKSKQMNVLKQVVLALLLMLPMGLMAQSGKLGHVNTQNLLEVMPEVDKANKAIDTLQNQYASELKSLQDEFQKKYDAYTTLPVTTPEGIKNSKRDELQQMQDRMQQFQVNAQSDLQKKQEELMTPIQKRVKDAISAVAKENNYTYVFDDQVLLYSIPGDDITALVKKKLGIK
jgi:outer membrane protein